MIGRVGLKPTSAIPIPRGIGIGHTPLLQALSGANGAQRRKRSRRVEQPQALTGKALVQGSEAEPKRPATTGHAVPRGIGATSPLPHAPALFLP